ncbi:MAG: AlpA family phage regulatory protein [Alcanivorax sp.]|nr:AlpA family phage regulatory protein [Alcanivorax sp.]
MKKAYSAHAICSTASGGEAQILRRSDVEVITGLSKSTIYAKMDSKSPYFDPDWPKKVNLGPRSVGWYRHEVIKWVESRSTSAAWEA